jgi:clan AA aspartic protease (TIGR02281 family)
MIKSARTWACALTFATAATVSGCSRSQSEAKPSPVPARTDVRPVAAGASPPAAQVSGDELQTEVPIEGNSGTFVVPVTINGVISLKFTIDSGAADVTIPADVATTLMRAGTVSRSDYIGSQIFILADGTRVPSAEFRIRTLKIGTLVLHDVVGSLTHAEGTLLLGQSFLSRLQTWSIDNKRHTLLLKTEPGAAELGRPEPTIDAQFDYRSDPQPDRQSNPDTASLPTSIESAGRSAGFDTQSADARTVAERYFAAWSDPNDPAGTSIRSFYAREVNFYGSQLGIDELMVQKSAFTKRWPSRAYTIRPGSLVISCKIEPICVVRGLVDWAASSPSEGRRAAGVASFAMTLENDRIVSEGGGVVSRAKN